MKLGAETGNREKIPTKESRCGSQGSVVQVNRELACLRER